jgi:hypothetical protein
MSELRIPRSLAAASSAQSGRFFRVALATCALLIPGEALGAEPVDTQLPNYDIAWTSASASIVDSMPIGNGAVTALVWAEPNKDRRPRSLSR